MVFKIILNIIILILIICIVFCVGLALFLMLFVTQPKRPSMEECKKDAKKNNVYDAFLAYTKEDVVIPSFDGYQLHGWLIRSSSDKYVIITHGYCANRWTMVKYAVMMLEMGYGVFLYDLRNFGENKKTYCSLGKNEPKDLLLVIEEVRRRVGDFAQIGLLGESLGSATTILALPKTKGISFAIVDCPFADLGMLLEAGIKAFLHMPAAWSHLASYASLIFHRYRLDRIRPIDAAEQITCPILFIHGDSDRLIDKKHSQLMYDRVKGPKEIYFMEGADHADSLHKDPETYHRVVKDFLQKNCR